MVLDRRISEMANLKQLDILKKGVDSWNLWRTNNAKVQPSLSEAGLHMAYLKEANLSMADLSDADLRMAELVEANLYEADLTWANLNEAFLYGADLRRAKIQKANLARANLQGANLSNAVLTWSTLGRANLQSAQFVEADLNATNLCGSDLRDANLKHASLIGANLTRANLEDADLSHAIVGGSLFGNVDLSVVKGLDTLVHLGPSTIGIDTVFKSKGNIPEAFLQNAGVPTDLFKSIKSQIDLQGIYTSCFITYTRKDESFAHKLFSDLQQLGMRCWVVTEQMRKKERHYPIIDAALNLHDKHILIVSENSLERNWLEGEIEISLAKEDETGQPILIPLVLDDSIKFSEKPWVVKLRRSSQLYDFTLWEDDEIYREMLEYLVSEIDGTKDHFNQ